MRVQLIEEATQEILGQVNKELMENQLKAIVPEAHSIDLVISSQYVPCSVISRKNAN